ncbi:hypothetical protein ACWDTT_15845 [Streptosporangium sandarakinum]
MSTNGMSADDLIKLLRGAFGGAPIRIANQIGHTLAVREIRRTSSGVVEIEVGPAPVRVPRSYGEGR